VQAWNDRSFHFSKKLRQLLQNCSIPLPIPAELTRLQAYCKAQGILDGPEALTRVRNALVHPTPSKRKLLQQEPGAAMDAWALALWYLDLIILNVCAYSGRYSNRMIGGWRGDEIMKVPWAPSRNSSSVSPERIGDGFLLSGAESNNSARGQSASSVPKKRARFP
jgi:hypothetical protein